MKKLVDPSEKVAIFFCNAVTYKKYGNANNDIFKYWLDKWVEKETPFLWNESLHSWGLSAILGDNDSKVHFFFERFIESNTVDNILIKNLLKGYTLIKNHSSESSDFIRNYSKMFGLGQSKSTFYDCFVRTFAKYPLMATLDIPYRYSIRGEEKISKLIEDLSNYINLVDKNS